MGSVVAKAWGDAVDPNVTYLVNKRGEIVKQRGRTRTSPRCTAD
jgi:hypothetical protein